MPYPYIFTEMPVPNGSYADENATQRYIMTYALNNVYTQSVEQGGIAQLRHFLIQISAEIDSVLLRAGYVVPPPAGVAILPILENIASLGAAAQLEMARYESGEDTEAGKHASVLQQSYDGLLGLLERHEIDGLLMGMVSSGWAPQSDRTKYYKSGNLTSKADGTSKGPQFTIDMQF